MHFTFNKYFTLFPHDPLNLCCNAVAVNFKDCLPLQMNIIMLCKLKIL